MELYVTDDTDLATVFICNSKAKIQTIAIAMYTWMDSKNLVYICGYVCVYIKFH